jgi:acetolactate synthase I/II/III large subunit
MIDSLAKNPEIDYVCAQHEQASAMMADGYSRVSGNLGVAISTSGPGATNMVTGVASAYYDSVPVLYLTGQVATFRLKGDRGIRQLGFQETDTVDIFKPVTKYAVMIREPSMIRYELEKAVYISKSGRPGPVVVDIPDDLQRENIDPSSLCSYIPDVTEVSNNAPSKKISESIRLINQSKRPVVVLGWGIRLSQSEKEALKFIEALEFPVLLSFAMRDFLESSSPLNVGSFGTHGTRYGNFTIQNADLVIVIGSRLDSKKSGSPPKDFAREAKKIIVDIDQSELNKFKGIGINVDVLIQKDCKKFFNAIANRFNEVSTQNIAPWRKQIKKWKDKFPICRPECSKDEALDPYFLMKTLSGVLDEGDTLISDTGCGLVWAAQAFEFKKHQRLIHAFNFTPMGYALPASIGACFANNGKRVICLTGDGGLQMNIQELATVIGHQLPIKVILINNKGYSMIGQTQDEWLGSRHEASTVKHGLAFPDFEKLAVAYGFRTTGIFRNKDMLEKLTTVVSGDEPSFCNIEISFDQKVIPQVKYGRPLEDGDPLLSRKTFGGNMLIKPTDISLKDH